MFTYHHGTGLYNWVDRIENINVAMYNGMDRSKWSNLAHQFAIIEDLVKNKKILIDLEKDYDQFKLTTDDVINKAHLRIVEIDERLNLITESIGSLANSVNALKTRLDIFDESIKTLKNHVDEFGRKFAKYEDRGLGLLVETEMFPVIAEDKQINTTIPLNNVP